MIKLIILLKRKQGMSLDDFQAYWHGTHGKVVMGTPPFSDYIRRYVQSPNVRGARSAFASDDSGFDGAAEVWFDDVESMNKAFAEPRYLEIVRPDELNFVDLDGCKVMVVEELPQYTPEGSAATVGK